MLRTLMMIVIFLVLPSLPILAACPEIDPDNNQRTDLNDQVKILQVLTRNPAGIVDPQAVYSDIDQDGNLGMAENLLISQTAGGNAKCHQPVIISVPSQYPTITAAIAASQPGWVIEVAAGTYNENIVIDKPLTLRGASMAQTILDVSGIVAGEPCNHPVIRIQSDDVVVRDFTITGGVPGIKVSGKNAFIIGNRIIKNVPTAPCDEFGIAWGIGVEVNGNLCTIQNNIIAHNGFRSSTDPVPNVGGGGFGILVGGAISTSILNNVISDNTGYSGSLSYHGGYGIYVITGMSFTYPGWITNNIITDNDYLSPDSINQSWGVGILVPGPGFEIDYNNVWSNDQNDTGNSVDYAEWAAPGAHDISADPQFVDQIWYHLTPTSPSIDAGDPASAFALEPMPNGGLINQGAYGNTPEATPSSLL